MAGHCSQKTASQIRKTPNASITAEHPMSKAFACDGCEFSQAFHGAVQV